MFIKCTLAPKLRKIAVSSLLFAALILTSANPASATYSLYDEEPGGGGFDACFALCRLMVNLDHPECIPKDPAFSVFLRCNGYRTVCALEYCSLD